MAKREHGVYKYVYNNEVVYIGKTDAVNGFQNRINSHSKEHELFNKSKIYIHLCKDQTETDSLETILINAYKPVLNKAKLYEYEIIPPDLEWIAWETYMNNDKTIKLSDIISRLENGTNLIQIGGRIYYFPHDVHCMASDFYGMYHNANFFMDNGIRIGCNMDFPTRKLLLKMKDQIDYNLDNYDELKEEFMSEQCEKVVDLLTENGFIVDTDA